MLEWILVSFYLIESGMQIKLTFLGAARSVTGSRFLIEADGLRILVDCGMHQERALRCRDWDSFPVPPSSINAVFLTHAHLDHCGYLPKLVKDGFKNPVYCTSATADIAQIILMDSAKIQQQDAENKKKRHQREKRKVDRPELPLYTTDEAEACFTFFTPVPYKHPVSLGRGITCTFHDAGHVLGAAMLELKIKIDGEERTLLFSGDIGKSNRPILRDPTTFKKADYVVMESTYGDRLLEPPDTLSQNLADIVNATVKVGGNIVIPSFALERAQDLLYFLSQALDTEMIQPINVFLDSPMAVDITGIFRRHMDIFDEETKILIKEKKSPFSFPGLRLMTSVEESKEIDRVDEPSIIIAGSGMCTGGRIKYHLISNISRKESTILFVGYQAEGTLGRLIVDGEKRVRILGEYYRVRAKIKQLNGFSSHADKNELLQWISSLENTPRHIFIVHGEEKAANHLAHAIRQNKNWEVTVPGYQDEVIID
jgi:metallo-beta-lactamase family protein